MSERICLIGFDPAEVASLAARLPLPVVAHELLPRIIVDDGQLLVEKPSGFHYLPVSNVVFHGIFEHDVEFLAALVLWGGPCFPNPMAMLDCRLRLPGLVRALRFTRFAGRRGFASADAEFTTPRPSVAKWGNWHCGENKARFVGRWQHPEACLIEPFIAGEAVRVVCLGGPARQIRLTGPDWLKSVHGPGAAWMPADPELVADTLAIQRGLGLDLLANDYMVTPNERFLLEVNHIPSVTCLPELWEEYQATVAAWVQQSR